MAYLRLEAGDNYSLEVPGKGIVTWSKATPVPDVDLPADLIVKAGLLRETVPVYDKHGASKGSVKRFKVVPRPSAPAASTDPAEDESLELTVEERALLREEAAKKPKAAK